MWGGGGTFLVSPGGVVGGARAGVKPVGCLANFEMLFAGSGSSRDPNTLTNPQRGPVDYAGNTSNTAGAWFSKGWMFGLRGFLRVSMAFGGFWRLLWLWLWLSASSASLQHSQHHRLLAFWNV